MYWDSLRSFWIFIITLPVLCILMMFFSCEVFFSGERSPNISEAHSMQESSSEKTLYQRPLVWHSRQLGADRPSLQAVSSQQMSILSFQNKGQVRGTWHNSLLPLPWAHRRDFSEITSKPEQSNSSKMVRSNKIGPKEPYGNIWSSRTHLILGLCG